MSHSLNPAPTAAAVPAVVNAVINGVIAYNGHKHRAEVPLTVDAISSTEATVGAEAAMIAIALAVILTAITAALARKSVPARPGDVALARRVAGMALENALTLFGATIVLAVLWQRVMGTLMVSPAVAALIVGVFAAAVTVVVHVRTSRELLRA